MHAQFSSFGWVGLERETEREKIPRDPHRKQLDQGSYHHLHAIYIVGALAKKMSALLVHSTHVCIDTRRCNNTHIYMYTLWQMCRDLEFP